MQKEIEYILAVAEEGSISKAAERLYVGQPAVSKTISALEKTLELKLFVRERLGMVPTEAGIVYIEYARRVAEIDREMHQRFSGMQKKEKISIAMTLNASSLLTAEINDEIAEHSHRFALQLDNVLSKDILSVLRSGKYQYAVCPDRILENQGDIHKEPLLNRGWLFITPRDYPLADPAVADDHFRDLLVMPETVLKSPLILQEEGTNIRNDINELLNLDNTPSFREKMQVANSLLAIQCVQDGLGCAVISDTSRVYLDENRLNVYRIKSQSNAMTCLAYLKGRKIPAAERSCIRTVERILYQQNNKVNG